MAPVKDYLKDAPGFAVRRVTSFQRVFELGEQYFDDQLQLSSLGFRQVIQIGSHTP